MFPMHASIDVQHPGYWWGVWTIFGSDPDLKVPMTGDGPEAMVQSSVDKALLSSALCSHDEFDTKLMFIET